MQKSPKPTLLKANFNLNMPRILNLVIISPRSCYISQNTDLTGCKHDMAKDSIILIKPMWQNQMEKRAK